MARTIYTKDKKDFLRYYEKPDEENNLKQVVEWRDSIIIGKVDIRILIPPFTKIAKEELKLIKD